MLLTQVSHRSHTGLSFEQELQTSLLRVPRPAISVFRLTTVTRHRTADHVFVSLSHRREPERCGVEFSFQLSRHTMNEEFEVVMQ